MSTDTPKTYNAFDITISLSDESGVDLNNSKYILNDISNPLNGLNGYEWNDITTNSLTFSARQKEEGKYYLHVFSEDLEGNKTENIKEINIIKGDVGTFIVSDTSGSYFCCSSDKEKTYSFIIGMNWQEYINSEYNVDGRMFDDSSTGDIYYNSSIWGNEPSNIYQNLLDSITTNNIYNYYSSCMCSNPT